MDTKHDERYEIPYLSDDELMKMIDCIEQTQGECVQAPGMLEERVMQGIAPKEMVSLEDRISRKRKELQRYTIRVALSAAASIAILLAFPLIQQDGLLQQGQEQQTEELSVTATEYRAQREQKASKKQQEKQQQEFEKQKEVWKSRDEKRREDYENRGQQEKEGSLQDGFENIISIMRRITK